MILTSMSISHLFLSDMIQFAIFWWGIFYDIANLLIFSFGVTFLILLFYRMFWIIQYLLFYLYQTIQDCSYAGGFTFGLTLCIRETIIEVNSRWFILIWVKKLQYFYWIYGWICPSIVISNIFYFESLFVLKDLSSKNLLIYCDFA